VEAADHEAVPAGIEDREREALVATGVLERVVANQADVAERGAQLLLDGRRPVLQLVEAPADRADALQVLAEDRLEVATARPAGQRIEAPRQAVDPAGLGEQDDEGDDERDADDGEGDDDLILLDEGLEIDVAASRATAVPTPASLPSGSHRGDIADRACRRSRAGPVVSFAAVAKRVRYSSRPARRAAPKRPSSGVTRDRPGPSPTPAPTRIPPPNAFEPATGPDELPRASSGHLTDAELRRAEELQAEIAAQERAAIAEAIRRKTRALAGSSYADDVNAPLKVRAAHEYAYVARDVRRIIVTGGIMVAILAALAILINVMGVVPV
jgi:hypothetical protein